MEERNEYHWKLSSTQQTGHLRRPNNELKKRLF